MAVYVPPTPIVIPYCDDGAFVPLPAGPSTTAANESTGFPPLQATPLNAGGIPVDIEQFNGMMNYYSAQILAQVAGVQPTFEAAFSSKYGGYPAGIILYCASNNSYQISLIDNNTANFNTTPSYIDDGINWLSKQSFFNLIINKGGTLKLYNGSNTFYTAFNSVATSNAGYNLPPAIPTSSDMFLGCDTGGNMYFKSPIIRNMSNYNTITISSLIQTLNSFTLTPGKWFISFNLYLNLVGTFTSAAVGINTVSTGVIGNFAQDTITLENNGQTSYSLINYYVDISVSTLFYLVINNIGLSGTAINSNLMAFYLGEH